MSRHRTTLVALSVVSGSLVLASCATDPGVTVVTGSPPRTSIAGSPEVTPISPVPTTIVGP